MSKTRNVTYKRSSKVSLSALSAMLCAFAPVTVSVTGFGLVNSLQAADADQTLTVQDDPSINETGAWSEAAIADGQNKKIDKAAVADLPPKLREIWTADSTLQPRKVLTSDDLADELIPAYGVKYITAQRSISRVDPLFLKAQKYLTRVNIKVMNGTLGRRAPANGMSAAQEGMNPGKAEPAGLSPEETEIESLHQDLINLRQQIAYPSMLERQQLDEIAGNLGKAQALLNYDLSAEGIKRIDDQYAAWQVQIEATRLRAVEARTDAIMAQNPSWNRSRARRLADTPELKFTLPPLPTGDNAMSEAQAALTSAQALSGAARERAPVKSVEQTAADKQSDMQAEPTQADDNVKEQTTAPAVEDNEFQFATEPDTGAAEIKSATTPATMPVTTPGDMDTSTDSDLNADAASDTATDTSSDMDTEIAPQQKADATSDLDIKVEDIAIDGDMSADQGADNTSAEPETQTDTTASQAEPTTQPQDEPESDVKPAAEPTEPATEPEKKQDNGDSSDFQDDFDFE